MSVADRLAVSAILGDAFRQLIPRACAFLGDGQGKGLGRGQTGAKLIEQIQNDALLHEDLGVSCPAVPGGAQPQYTVQPVFLAALLGFVIYAEIPQPQCQLQCKHVQIHDYPFAREIFFYIVIYTKSILDNASVGMVSIHSQIRTEIDCNANIAAYFARGILAL